MTMNQKKREPWRNETRHYCAACNVWLDNNRASIMTHENGRKHQEAVARGLEEKRRDRIKEERDLKFLQSSLKKMENAALQSHLQNDTGLFVNDPKAPETNHRVHPAGIPSPQPVPVTSSKKERQEWNSRKRQRLNAKQQANDTLKDELLQQRKKINGNEGSYQIDDNIYLEGLTYSAILEEDMPVEIWIGPIASLEEKRLIDRQVHWKKGIITTVRKNAKGVKLHVAYLISPDSSEETTELNVAIDRVRILLVSDDKIPDTLEEARLLATGGEEIAVEPKEAAEIVAETGLSTWSTVAIKRSTFRQEHKEERDRLREKRKRVALEREAQEKEAEMRRMEAAKVANADDSALGAFDALGTGDYRGVEIHQEAEITLADTAKRLAKGSVAFKKKKRKSSKRSIRQTSSG